MKTTLGSRALLLLIASACDPVHTDAVTALGGEANGVRTGPEHRPGQPCLVCHGGSGPATARWSVAGTIYREKGDSKGIAGVQVNLVDAKGASMTASTNRAGNFYIDQASWDPSYPMQVSIAYGGTTVPMKTIVGRDGSCAGCHSEPAGPTSAGAIFLSATAAGVP